MKNKTFLSTFVIVLLIFSSCAPKTEKKANNELKLYVIGSASPAYIKEWVTTAPENPVKIVKLKQLKRGEIGYFSFVSSGYSSDKNDNIDLSVHFALVGPDGKAVFERRNYASSKGAMSKPGYVMLDPALDIGFDSTDPLGKYRVVGILEDRVTNTKAIDEIQFQLVE